MTALVDVAINYYGKPWQTRLTIETLLAHSAHHIGRIYLVKELEQPRADERIETVTDAFPGLIEVYTPPRFLGYWSLGSLGLLQDEAVRISARYQYPLEATDKRYMLISHNDMEYTADLVGELLVAIQDGPHVGAGLIGQCWNCPAQFAGLCDSTRAESLKLSYWQAVWLALTIKSPRTRPWMISRRHPTPLPECRLNEFACLIDVEQYRRHTMPAGAAPPIGISDGRTDTGCAWYRAVIRQGGTFANVPITKFSTHSCGHEKLFDAGSYDQAEERARERVLQAYGNKETCS